MSSPAKPSMPGRTLRTAVVAAVALASLAAGAARIVTDAPPPPVPRTTLESGYQVRCWQYGRLLFEERAIQLGAEAPGGVKLQGTDARRQPLMVTDTGNATCLIRRIPAKP